MGGLRFFYKYSVAAMLFWIVLIFGSAVLKLKTEEGQINEIIKTEAMNTLDKDKALAFWLMQHSGAPEAQGAPTDFTEIIGAQTKIVGYKRFASLKDSDPWLVGTLEQMKIDKKERYEIMSNDDTHYSRLAAPLTATQKCSQCHEGVKAGDMIGVMAISMPMKSYTKMRENVTSLVIASHFVALLLGLVFIYAVFRLTKKYVRSIEEQKEKEIQDYEDTLNLLVGLMEERDAYTAGHAERVAKYCTLIGGKMGLSDERLEILKEASRLHDIGKIAVPDTVLLKPGKLSDSEYVSIQSHVTDGYKIISKMKKYAHLAEIIEYHHEKYDGTGYPTGKRGDEVPLESSIMAVADSFDAMTTNRIYKPRKSVLDAIEEIVRCKNTQFHPLVADAAVEALRGVEIPRHISQLEDSVRHEHRLAFFFRDSLTGLYNLEYLKLITQNEANELKDFGYVSVINIKNLGAYNKAYGWEAGNVLLKGVAEFILANFKECVAFRVYGDIFIVACKEDCGVCDSDIGSSLPKEAIDIGTITVNVTCTNGLDVTEFGYMNIKKQAGLPSRNDENAVLGD